MSQAATVYPPQLIPPVVPSSVTSAIYDQGGAVFEASSYGASKNSAALAAALTAATGSRGTVNMTGPGWTISANHPIPAGAKLRMRGATISVTATGGIDVFSLGEKATIEADGGTYISIAGTANIARLFTNANHVGPNGQEWCAILGQPGAQVQVLSGAVVGVAIIDLVCAYANTTAEGWTFDGLAYTAAPMARVAAGNTSFGPVLLRNLWCANSTAAQIVVDDNALGGSYNSDIWIENCTVEMNSAGAYGVKLIGSGGLNTVTLRSLHIERHVNDTAASHGIYVDGATVLIDGVNYSMTNSNGSPGVSNLLTLTNNANNHVLARSLRNMGGTNIIHDLKYPRDITGSYLSSYDSDTPWLPAPTGTPTGAVGANNGSSSPTPAIVAGSTTTAGQVTFGSGTGPTAGAQVIVFYPSTLPASAVARSINVVPINAATAALGTPYISTSNGNGFVVSTPNAPTASQGNTAHGYYYQVAL